MCTRAHKRRHTHTHTPHLAALSICGPLGLSWAPARPLPSFSVHPWLCRARNRPVFCTFNCPCEDKVLMGSNLNPSSCRRPSFPSQGHWQTSPLLCPRASTPPCPNAAWAGSSGNPKLDLESWREFADEFMTFLLPGSSSNIQTRNRSAEDS